MIDNEDIFDRYLDEMKNLGSKAEEIHEKMKNYVKNIWQQQLEK